MGLRKPLFANSPKVTSLGAGWGAGSQCFAVDQPVRLGITASNRGRKERCSICHHPGFQFLSEGNVSNLWPCRVRNSVSQGFIILAQHMALQLENNFVADRILAG